MLKTSSFLSPSLLSSKFSTQTSSSSSSSSCSQLSDVLLAASLTKSLSSTKPSSNNLPLPLPDSVLVHLLRHPSLTPSTKLSLFTNSSNTTTNNISSSSSALLFSLSRSPPRHLLPALRLSLSLSSTTVTLSPSAFRSALDSLLRSSRFDDAIAALDLAHRNHPHLLTPHTYSSVILALLRKSHLPLALSLFRNILLSSSSSPPSYPTHLSTNTLLLSLLKSDLRDDFRHLFDLLSQREYPFDLHGHNILIHAFGLWGHLGLALSLFKRLHSPDLCTYNSLLKALCSNGKLNDALKAYQDMKEYGHDPDRFTYRTLIHACVRSYLVDDAMRVFKEMKEYNNVKADTVVYNSLLDGLLKVGRLTEACRFFQKMVSDGVRASTCSFNILIDGLFKNGRAAAGFALFCDLKKKGQLVDAISYSILVSNLSREGRVAEALELVKEMEGRGFVVDLVTITSILIGLHKIGRWDMAERLVKHVRDSALLPNVLRWKDDMEASLQSPQDKGKDYTPLFPSVGSLGDIMSWANLTSPGGEEDREGYDSSDGERKDEWSLSPYLDRLANKSDPSDDDSWMFSASRGKRVQDKGIKSFDVDMVNTYMSIFLAKGKLSRACKLFEIFSSFGTDPVSYTYNSLMSSFIKKGYMKEAWGILQEMGDKHCPADVATYNLIIQGLGKMGKADLGTNVLDRMLKKGGYLDIVMYNTLLHALGKAGRMDEVNTLFDKMTRSGINPDVVTYNTLIEVHAKAGHVKEAYKFLRKMLAAGCSPNHVTDTILDFLEKEVEQMRQRQASMRREEELDTNR